MSMRPGLRSDAAARLLLIDRNPASGRAMVANLANCFVASPELVELRGAREAVDLLRMEAFDIVLVDLPGLEDLAPQLEDAVGRLVKLAAGALVIVLSDGASVSAAVAAMRAGAHDFIARPIGASAFSARIGELAQRHG
jgi:two-component system repressor protein LuxO